MYVCAVLSWQKLLVHLALKDFVLLRVKRSLIQSGVVVIPKSTHKIRMIQNIDVFDFVLDEEDMAAIQKLDTKESLFFSHYDPSTVEMLTGLHR